MKDAEDEAFDELARRQGMWGGGFQAKRAAAADKTQEPVLDLDGHVVGKARKPKGQQMPRDAEIARLNEKVEFLARTNMLYSDWEHRETQVTSELIRKGMEEAKINAELRAEIEQLKAQLAQPAQEPCDMGAMCLGCEPRNPDGSCPDARSAQKPVAWMWKDMRGQDVVSLFEPRLNSIPLYIIPPKRPWVGLTAEEIHDTDGYKETREMYRFAHAIEAKLKEKNNG